MFRRNNTQSSDSSRLPEFSYLKPRYSYMDSSCQSLRPKPVIDALKDYYETYGACGGRVKYAWGQKVDSLVEETRDLIIDYLKLSKKDYACSFTLNSTYGLNLILSQLPKGKYKRIITSEIEHNSVFLPTIVQADRLGIDRKVLPRSEDGSLLYDKSDLDHAIIVVNTTSNIDGRLLTNLEQIVRDAHDANGIVILDAAQTVAHHVELLYGCDADAICFSAHKTYAASLGVILAKKKLIKSLVINFMGGGMVTKVSKESYEIWPDEMSSWLEPGLQAYGEIISLNTSIRWLKNLKPGGMKPTDYIDRLSRQLFQGLSDIPGIVMINKTPSPVISLYHEDMDSHRLATFLSASNIMSRSGYFCCHYYLLEKLKLPPLIRFSLGLHSTEDDIERTIKELRRVIKA